MILHGTGLRAEDAPRIASAQASVVWCPEADRRLYGATAPVEFPRQASDSDGGLSWAAARQLEVAEALTAMTVAAAWASFEENIKGVLMAGHLADIVVLSADPFSAPPEEIPGIEIDMTVFDGRVVHSRE